jgi:aryl-alcohol dehydrogenase-like predicted oxidoreductase
MQTVAFGATGIEVSRLGLGCGAVGDPSLGEGEAERLLLGAFDLGVRFFDAARSYGLAEERLGRYLGARRREVALSTKGGYGASSADDWTADAITRGIDEALSRLRTDRIDVFHLHSCPLDVLRRDELLRALEDARAAGKVRVTAYAGDHPELDWAVGAPLFGSVQCSVNLFDQRALHDAVPRAADRGLGVVAKRPLGNAPWRFADRPEGSDAAFSWDRMRALGLDPSPLPWDALALRFAAFAPGVSCIALGTTSLEHLRVAARHLADGPLDPALFDRVRARFQRVGADWPARI